jgi:hypothetical protein
LEHFDDTASSLVIPSPDSTLGAGLESMESMQRAALYARVSTDAQQKEATVESQLSELKRQIASAGHVLVKEYIDDGISGTLLDRPALNQMRADLKIGLFDSIYFLAADRIARGRSIRLGKSVLTRPRPTSDIGRPRPRLTGCTVATIPADYSPPVRYPAIRPWLVGSECSSIN